MSVVGTTLSVVHFTVSVVSVGWTLYSVGWAQCITHRSVANIYSVGCAQCSVSCKHILCRLYTVLAFSDHSPFLGKFLKTNSTKNYTITTYGASTGCVGCPRLQLPWRGSPRRCPWKMIFCVIKYILEKFGDVGRASKNSTVQISFDFRLPSPFDVSIRVNTVEYNNTTTFTEIPVDKWISN